MAILNFQQTGQGDHVILIHGLLGSLENLNMVAKPLSEHFTVTNLDVRNHGSSPQLPEMNYDELAKDVLETMAHLSIDNAIVLGHSMGGKIAMQLALNHPNKVSQLIVADISPVQYPPHHQEILKGLAAIDLATISSRKDADATLSHYVNEAGVRQFLLRNLTKTEAGFAFRCHLENITLGYSEVMKGYKGTNSFDKPALFIKGGNSQYITQEHQSIIGTLFPNAKAKIIQGAGHWLHAEKTVAFCKIVENFIQDQ